jgi:hypothetical protein
VVIIGALVTAWALATHPMHTTLTEVSVDRARHVVRATVRVFSDDLARAVGHTPVSEAQAIAYASAALPLTADGHTVPLKGCGIRTSGDLLWICLEGSFAGDGHALALRDTMLCELFSDQVNIVQVAAGGSKKSLLFTRGDGAKLL